MDTDEEDMVVIAAAQQWISSTVLQPRKRKKIDHRQLPREAKRQFRHLEAYNSIMYDYLGPDPLFGKEFPLMFRVSRGRFQCILEDFGNLHHPFYQDEPVDCFGQKGASMEAKLLLPLKCMAYGVPAHTFMDYFSMSTTLARVSVKNFQEQMVGLYLEEYLRVPTSQDIKNILRLHKSVHRGMDGMLGSLDCMHTYWDKCPVAWQGSFKSGAKKKPSIVLEAVADHNLWFWHASYGYAGTLNDINIINLSPLKEAFLDGSLEDLEKESVPFKIGEDEFHKIYLLVDGIYPKFSRFVKAFKQPSNDYEKALTSWQEGARKDIERAFGVLQAKFQCLARPILLRALYRIEAMVTCALILHNMCVSDRVMGDTRARYNPSHNVMPSTADADVEDVEYPGDFDEISTRRRRNQLRRGAVTGIEFADEEVRELLLRKNRWKALHDKNELARLHTALMRVLGLQYIANKA
jgi:hypothetical protein